MRYPLLVAVVVIAVLAGLAVGWWRSRASGRERRGWVANTGYLRDLPHYRELVRGTRRGLAAFTVALAAVVAGAAMVAGSPVDRYTSNETKANRDIVLCLDVSGSMIPYDGEIARTFATLLESFQGERISLQIWSAQSVVFFPLTDDYDMAIEVLTEMADIMDRGYLGQDDTGVYVTQELLDYLEGVDAADGQEIASLAGDGLASCVTGFDQEDTERSRTIILATDNEILGPQIYTTAEAVDFATDNGVRIIALYPGDGSNMPAEGNELRSLVEGAGGLFYGASDPDAIDGIVADIESQQTVEMSGDDITVETDTPRTAVTVLIVGVLALLAVGGWVRL